MPLQATSGAASYDAFGGGVPVEPVYIESIFQTWLYTGNGSTQTITNGIDLAGEGGLVWIKDRSAARSNVLFDTVRGATMRLISNSTAAQNNETTALGGFLSNGFSTGYKPEVNESGETYASWTFRKQPKFFDVVTYTGTGSTQTIAHNLGSVPGCIIVKATNDTRSWAVYHRSLGATKYIYLNSTGIGGTTNGFWDDTEPTSTVFTVRNDGDVNGPGTTYVAYLFAHNAGGFGLSGTDNVISCGSYTGDDSDNGSKQVTLGFEPQWVLIKSITDVQNWFVVDNMRGMTANGSCNYLRPNLSSEEAELSLIAPTATGFNLRNAAINTSGSTYIYIAIRRGPMRTPTTGTSVYSASWFQDGNTQTETNFPVDLAIEKYGYKNDSQVNVTGSNWFYDRLRGVNALLVSNSTAAETSSKPTFYVSGFDSNTTIKVASSNITGSYGMFWNFRRAPGFFDEICFSGTGANTTQAHNLQKAPELWLVKSRSATTQWVFGSSLLGANEKIVMPSPNGRVTDTTVWNNTYPTSSVLSLGTSSTTNASGATFVGYLMATAVGVSKVGTYTGNGSSQTIDCGFTGGARFVMIIRATASTAQDVYIWDSARGIVAGNDPRLSLNTLAAEVTTLDTVDADSSGFIVNTDASNVNVNGAVYLYWSVA